MSALTAGGAGAGGAGWSVQPSPSPPGALYSNLAGVSCPTAASCTAVGDYGSSTGVHTLVLHSSAGHWTIQPSPDLAGANDNLLNAVSCQTPTSCTAVGYTVSSTSRVRALAEQWDGTTWRIVPTPLPTGATWVEMAGVSCPAAGACIAVGGLIKGGVNAQEQPLSEAWNGTAWSVLPTPNPHAENGSDLSSVSCTSIAACTAGGGYAYADVAQSVFAFRWNGTSWTMQNQPNPGGQSINSDNAVSCGGPHDCTVAGSWINISALPLAQHWNGTRWIGLKPPTPPPAVQAQFNGVSCPAAADCRAVGSSATNLNGYPTASLAEHWTATQWLVEPLPSPAGAQSTSLSAVDCRSTASCVAVGDWSKSKASLTLVEVYSG